MGRGITDVIVSPPQPAISLTRRLKVAARGIQAKWDALGGAPGQEKTPGDAGVVEVDIAHHYRDYTNGGAIYLDSNKHDAFYVYGVIGDRYREIGGPRSWMGWPISGELDFDEEGRIVKFEHGAIYWWPDTGAIELRDVAVRYRGLRCFGETDETSAADEPYVYLAATPPPPAQPIATRSVIYTDVDAGDARPDNIELFRGQPYGLAIGMVVMEHDLQDPDQFKGPIQGGVGALSAAVAGAVTAIPAVGLVLGPLAGAGLAAVHDDIVDFLNGIVSGAPDLIGTTTLTITPKQMVAKTRADRFGYNGLEYHLESDLIEDGEASYKVVFDIEAV